MTKSIAIILDLIGTTYSKNIEIFIHRNKLAEGLFVIINRY